MSNLKDYKKEKDTLMFEDDKYKHLLFYIKALKNFDFQYDSFNTNGDDYLLILKNTTSKNIKIYIFNDKIMFFYKNNEKKNKLDFRFVFKSKKSLRKVYNSMMQCDFITKILKDENIL